MNNHRVEVGEIRKQINTIQAKNSDNGLSNRLVRQQVRRDEYEKLAIESPFDRQDKPHTQCTFRTDIDPKPDIQVRK